MKDLTADVSTYLWTKYGAKEFQSGYLFHSTDTELRNLTNVVYFWFYNLIDEQVQ